MYSKYSQMRLIVTKNAHLSRSSSSELRELFRYLFLRQYTQIMTKTNTAITKSGIPTPKPTMSLQVSVKDRTLYDFINNTVTIGLFIGRGINILLKIKYFDFFIFRLLKDSVKHRNTRKLHVTPLNTYHRFEVFCNEREKN